eukprot:TRINITY_DN27556_c0_g1_i1.p1 TRINITY_DN27556_c0_g1~~TRINITY_DN27556_c0_g1_i1.p1  ORF type:complete len:145 (-),score=17.50 TRINITY_DN27556_c0_g1_i1:140-574(-)
MKVSFLIPLFIAFASTGAVAKNKTAYADIQVTDVDPTSDFIWQRANQNTPKYPVELARSGLRGCAVLAFNITDSGKTENIEVINTLPNKHIGKYSRKMLKNGSGACSNRDGFRKESIKVRFCMGGESVEQAEQACKQQTKLACS